MPVNKNKTRHMNEAFFKTKLDSSLEVYVFELLSYYFIDFQTIILEKGMNPFMHPGCVREWGRRDVVVNLLDCGLEVCVFEL